MKVISLNVRGMGNPERRMIIKEVLKFNKVQIAMLQISKLRLISDRIKRETWGGRFLKCCGFCKGYHLAMGLPRCYSVRFLVWRILSFGLGGGSIKQIEVGCSLGVRSQL